MDDITMSPIGIIHTPFQNIQDMPIQPAGARGVIGTIIITESYAQGLTDIEGFSHLILIYHFHRSKGFDLIVQPFLDNQTRGLFATRAPRRPNAIGLSVVRLLGREGHLLRVADIDVLDETPLLDIKPFVPDFDAPEVTSIGWLAGKTGQTAQIRSDDRFK